MTRAQRTCASFTSKHRPASRHRLKTFAFDSAGSFVGKLICHMRVCCFFLMFCICSISGTRRMVRMIMILMITMAMMCGIRLCYGYRVSVGPLCIYYNRIIHIVFARMLMSSLCVYMSFHSNPQSHVISLQFSGTRRLSRQVLQSNVGALRSQTSSLASDCRGRSQPHPPSGKCALVPSRTAANQTTAMYILSFACLNVCRTRQYLPKTELS